MIREEEIFEAASALTGAERSAYLDEACGGTPGLRERVEALLRSHENNAFMLHRTPGRSGQEHSPAERDGERIGRYKLLQKIGEGGFGVVWMAEQMEPVTRRVALKIIKAGMDTHEVIARFEAERQALAMMDHPNIARVLDAGATDKGRLYFVMELVKGMPITKFCDEQQFTTRQRLELFADVCSAINHAHQKGVIHRDIKPSNVMVTLHGDKPVPKVIDFGIAKATQGRLTDRTFFTRFEQFIGTPAYMSPEQTALSGLDIDTRSDIYSLGILLYELLTGKPPFDEKSLLSAGYEEMRRIIREVEPPRPSSRLSTAAGEERTTLAKTRHVAPEKLRRLVEADLDWIVMKAIEKDRTRRYQTVIGLSLDIQRFLASETVSATPPGAGYRFRKFMHRNRMALRVAAAIAMVLTAATVVSISMAVRALQAEKQANLKASDEIVARKLADQALMNAESTSRFFAGVIRSADPNSGGRSMTVVEAMDLAIGDLEKDISSPTAKDIERLDSMMWTLHKLGFTRRIIPLQEKVRNYCMATYGPHHEKSLVASLNLAFYISRGGEPEGKLEKAISILEGLVADEGSWPAERNKEWLETLANLSGCYQESNRIDDAIRIREKAVRHCRERYADDSGMTLTAMSALATCLCDAGHVRQAILIREELLQIHRKAGGAENPKTLWAIHHLANSYHDAGQTKKALELRENVVPLFRKVLGVENPDTLIAIHNFAESCFETGRKKEAISLLEEVLTHRPKASGPENRDTLEAKHDLATYYFDEGRRDQALKLREEVLPLRRKTLGREHPDTLEAMTNLAISWREAGRVPEAVALQEEAVAIMRRVLKGDHPFLKAAVDHMVLLYEMTGRKVEAEALRSQTTGDKK